MREISTIIEDVRALKIFNSRGEETVEVEVETVDGLGVASAPSGASRGKWEAIPFPPGGVEESIKKVEELIAPKLVGMDAEDQESIDETLREIDGTENFGNIGGNLAFAISLATAEAAADSHNLNLFQYLGGNLDIELPLPLGNVLGGGKHARGSVPDIQEFLVLPVGARTFEEAAELNVKVHRKIGEILLKKNVGFNGGRGDEGAWAVNLSNREALDVVNQAVEEVSDETGRECRFGLDIAASSIWNEDKGVYVYARDGVERRPQEQLEFVSEVIDKYRLIYVEDPFDEEDFESFRELTKEFRGKVMICGDDLFVTNRERLRRGIELGAANAIIIKVNQIGTLTEAFKTVKEAKKAGYVTIVSHRSGETTDTKIAHLAIGFHSPILKSGVLGGERIAKINEILRIESVFEGRTKLSSLQIR